MKKILVWLPIAAVVCAGFAMAYLYIALPTAWSVVHSDLRRCDLRGKVYYLIKIQSLRQEAARREKRGEKNIAANQVLRELHWLWHNTRDFKRVEGRIRDLRRVLDDPSLIGAADEQSAEYGSWGKWFTEWFFKADASYERINILAKEGRVPRYPARFLDRINSPEKLRAHLSRLLVSCPGHDGTDHSRELNETVSFLVRMLTRGQPANYAFHPRLKDALLDFIMNEIRDPETGYLAYRYRSENGVVKKISLSMTFHVASFLDGKVPDWPRIIDTTLAIKDRDYPSGWLDDGAYSNHHNMDVVELFRLGWPHATPGQKARMRAEIRNMLDWCLRDSLRADGSFKPSRYENDSVEEYNYFGASFLSRAGYFDPKKRFWTREEFPESAEVKGRIVKYIRAHYDSGGAGGTYYRNALERLGEKAPR